MKSSLILLIAASVASAHHHHHQVPVSLNQKYWDKGDANWDTVDKHADIFSDLVHGIKREPEESFEVAEKKR